MSQAWPSIERLQRSLGAVILAITGLGFAGINPKSVPSSPKGHVPFVGGGRALKLARSELKAIHRPRIAAQHRLLLGEPQMAEQVQAEVSPLRIAAGQFQDRPVAAPD